MTALDLPGDHVPKGADRDRPFEWRILVGGIQRILVVFY
jgi:hypothetical protein